jgi:DNA-binding CsgD family transcriptional regulator
MSDDTFDLIVDEIYEAATDDSLWTGLIRKIAEFTGGFGGSLTQWDTHHQTFPTYHQTGFSDEAYTQYSQHYLKIDPRPHAMLKMPSLQFYTDSILFPKELRNNHEFFDWEDANCDQRHGYGARLIKSSRFESMLILARSENQGPASHGDMHRLQMLTPHLRRSIFMARRLGERLTKQAFDALPFGVVLLDEEGRVVVANSAISSMVAKGDGLALSSAGLSLAGAGENDSLHRLIHLHQTRSHLQLSREPAGLLVPRPSGAKPYTILVHPLRRTSFAMPALNNAVMICVSDPDQTSFRSTALLEELFDLTPAESALCAALVQTGTLADAADKCGLTSGSARQYMKRIFAKTQTRGQVELVALIMGSVRA